LNTAFYIDSSGYFVRVHGHAGVIPPNTCNGRHKFHKHNINTAHCYSQLNQIKIIILFGSILLKYTRLSKSV